MQSLPKTPKKADDAIEKIKQSLSVKWGIQLPERGSTWSPSRRDPGRVEEKICTFIQMLYFRHSALDIAIINFEKNAINVYSKWQYKPKAENDVIPSREKPESKSEKGFSLRKRNDLPVQAVKELTESLLHHLSLIVDRVKHGEHFHPPNIIEGQSFEDRISLINWLAYTITDSPILSVEEYPPIMTAKSRGQASLTHWFRNKSAPGASATHEEAAQHFSSDDYADSEMSDFMANEAFTEIPVSQSTRPVPQGTIAASETDSPMDESFVTPPTTPPRSNMSGIGRGHMLEKRPVSLQGSINGTASALPTVDPTSNGNKKRPFPYSESMRPPPTRRISRERKTDRPMFDYAAPPSLPGNDSFLSRSLSSLRSIDDPFSVSSSFTSVSTAWTSPNTSFCAESAATSFDSTAEDTDTTIQPSLDQPQIRRPADQTDLSVRLEPPKSRREKDNAETGGKELMHSTSTRRDHEQYSTINADQFMKPALKPESQIQEELFDRLLSCSPFGILLTTSAYAISD